MGVKRLLAATLLAATSSVSFALTLAESGFVDGTEGWQAINGARNFRWVAHGGNPDGHVTARDLSAGSLWFFDAPSAFLGDLGAALGSTLRYALKSDSASSPLNRAFADVQLLGANGVLLAHGGAAAPGSDWTSYTVALVADGGWHIGSLEGAVATTADLAAVLANLSALRIRGDYYQASELTGLDNVVLTTVSEPATAALLLGGAALLLGLRRRD
ncbi:MAG: laminin B domain-containing protein [Rubrivivax sp.]